MKNDFNNIFQDILPLSPWHELALKKLPGLNPLNRKDWIVVDSAFDLQMRYADYLLQEHTHDVLKFDNCAKDASKELLESILSALVDNEDYTVDKHSVTRPDGRTIQLDWDRCLKTSRLLVQQDLCIMMKGKKEHILVGAAMCFPASWKLSEKIMQPMSAIHKPVDEYTENIAYRVEKMFCLMSPKQDMWRANWLIYNNPNLHQPRRAMDVRPRDSNKEQWVRVERQTFRKLPETQAIIFGIHTYVIPFRKLSDKQRETLFKVIN